VRAEKERSDADESLAWRCLTPMMRTAMSGFHLKAALSETLNAGGMRKS
jgi:hypothetical protein